MKFAVVLLACVLVAAEANTKRATSAFASVGTFPQLNQYNQYRAPQQFRAPLQKQFITPQYQPLVVKEAVVEPVVPVVNVLASTKKYYSGASDASAQIKSLNNDVNPDGSYAFSYETDNGIAAQAQATPRDFGGNPQVVVPVVQGSYSWTSPEGVPIAISYVADENGYQPQGDAIPTPPPVPAQIARALDYIARSAKTQY